MPTYNTSSRVVTISLVLVSSLLCARASASAVCGEPPADSAPPSLDAQLELAPPLAPRQVGGRSDSRGGGRRYSPWPAGRTVMQGFAGVSFLQKASAASGGSTDLELDQDDIKQFPYIGGGSQWKVAGERLDFGFDTMISFSGRANVAAFAFGGGGAAVAIDVDMLIVELFGGPFVNVFLGDRTRLYAGAGPEILFTNLNSSQALVVGGSSSSSGFGTGGYVRGGVEFRVRPGTMMGLGARWMDSRIDLSNGLGDLDVSGTQVLFTVTTGL